MAWRPDRTGPKRMTADQPRPRLVTHSGKFHCDEVFAYAVLRLALGVDAPGVDHTLVRTRKPDLIEAGDVVWDVGGCSTPRPTGSTTTSGALPCGRTARRSPPPGWCGRCTANGPWRPCWHRRRSDSPRRSPPSWTPPWCRRIDEIDNGVSVRGPLVDDSLGLAALVGDCNPSWDDPAGTGATAGDAAFLEATALAEGVLRRRVDGLRARLAAEAIVRGGARRRARPAHPGAGPGNAVEERGVRP